jgi:hypothetical protein
VINYIRAGLGPKKATLTRRFGRSRAHDHGRRMTSLVIIVICMFEYLGHI